MKQLKIWSMMMLMAMALPLMVACGGDDGNDDGSRDTELIKKAVGKWMCTESTDSYQGQTYSGLLVGKEIAIYANGTYTSTSSSFGHSGTYAVKGNTITAKNQAGDTFMVTVGINGDQMVWNGTSSTGVTFRYVFIREDETVSITAPF